MTFLFVNNALRRRIVYFLHILVFAFLAYSNTFDVPFVFDDIQNILNNTKIRSLGNIPDMFILIEGDLGSRPLTLATFSIDYYFGGFSPAGYHYVNLSLHIINALLLYVLIRLISRQLRKDGVYARYLAFVATLIFLVHPIQTEAVTYIVTRSTLLAMFFYLIGFIIFVNATSKSTPGSRKKSFYVFLLFVVSLMGVASRENFVTFPLMLILYDYFFVSERNVRKVLGNYPLHLPALSSMFYLAFLVTNFNYLGAGFNIKSFTTSEYILTQFNVFWTYLRLLLVPVGQNLDYEYPIAKTLLEFPTFLSFIGFTGLWATAIYLIKRRPTLSFCMLWLLITLTPVSSFVPLVDVIFEHRLYMPSAGFFVMAALAATSTAEKIINRWPGAEKGLRATAVLLILSLAVATYARNSVWENEETLWLDALSKSPTKTRVLNTLGAIYFNKGEIDKAIEYYQEALNVNYAYEKAHSNLAVAYVAKGLIDKALKHHRISLQLNPTSATSNFNMGIACEAKGNIAEAIGYYREAVRLNPDFVEAYNNLGACYIVRKQYEKAVESFSKAIYLERNYAMLYLNRGRAYELEGNQEMANKDYQMALRLNEVSY